MRRRALRGAPSAWRRLLVGLLARAGLAGTAGVVAFAGRGVSARPEPSRLEARIAREVRGALIPGSARRAANPLPRAPEVLESGRQHFREHCAPCHGSDGRADTPLARGLHPRAPDLTLAATQELSDGELFWIIESGVRLTGMPAFGRESPEDDERVWSLVHWIRRLPEPTAEETEASERAGRHEHAHP